MSATSGTNTPGSSSIVPGYLEPALTVSYKRVEDKDIYLDIYLPAAGYITSNGRHPAVVYFHGGGLCVGNRTSWFPYWLQSRLAASGYFFISTDYRLLPPSTGHDILQDIRSLFEFLASELNPLLLSVSQGAQIDVNAIAVAGNSAGGLCAYLAAMHAIPKPKALLSMYGMGGDILTPHYLSPKTSIFFRGRELLDPSQFLRYLHPLCLHLDSTSDSALSYHSDASITPGYPANPRMLLARLYLQLGAFLDYYSGMHEPSLSNILRNALVGEHDYSHDESITRGLSVHPDLEYLIPAAHLPLFPQFGVTASWPPTFLVHGALDTAVYVQESRNMYDLLCRAGVDVALRVIEGQEHSFDYAPNANDVFGGPGGLFEEIISFLDSRRHMVT